VEQPTVRDYAAPDWATVETAIRKLDQVHHSEVTLGDEAYISVGGGQGQYSVFIFTEEERNLILTDPSKSSGSDVLVSGGQSARIENQRIVDLDTALKAVKAYYQRRQADPSLQWIED
jgi:hypothetical protein